MKSTGTLAGLVIALSISTSGAASAAPRVTVVVDANNVPLRNDQPVIEGQPREVVRMIPHNPNVHAETPADTRILFMNNCMPNGCAIKTGNTDDRTQTSDIAQSNGTLTAWKWGAATWTDTMTCMKNVFSRFNVKIVDVDPGPNTAHYEIVVGGTASQIMGGGSSGGILGVADIACGDTGQCDPYIPNALVYAFADDPYYAQNTADEVCATAAQEIAHTWALDHVVDASDPMTYNSYNGIRQYKDGQKCGSDCQGGKSPFGLTCSGSGGQATHTCMLGGATQDEVKTITALFGSSAPAPTVAITAPTNGAAVSPGFTVTVTCTAADGVQSVDLSIDDSPAGTATAAPFKFTAPTTLANGTHHLSATCTTTGGGSATAVADVTQGSNCHSPADCPDSTDTCVDGACVAGSGSPGGLGSPCTMNTDCQSQSCGSDGTNKFCVVACDPTMNGCPSGFGCLAEGAGGVCWPGADSGGGGGCNTGANGGEVAFGLGFAALMLARRRARS